MGGAIKVKLSFKNEEKSLGAVLQTAAKASTRLQIARQRLEASKRRAEARTVTLERRARTRRLIEAGSLVEEAGLLDQFNDDRDALLGAYLELSQIVRSENGANALAIWKRRGQRCRERDAKAVDQ